MTLDCRLHGKLWPTQNALPDTKAPTPKQNVESARTLDPNTHSQVDQARKTIGKPSTSKQPSTPSQAKPTNQSRHKKQASTPSNTNNGTSEQIYQLDSSIRVSPPLPGLPQVMTRPSPRKAAKAEWVACTFFTSTNWLCTPAKRSDKMILDTQTTHKKWIKHGPNSGCPKRG